MRAHNIIGRVSAQITWELEGILPLNFYGHSFYFCVSRLQEKWHNLAKIGRTQDVHLLIREGPSLLYNNSGT